MALDSNATLHKAIQLHLNNLKKLSTPLDELQTSIPSMADIDEESEASITQVTALCGKNRTVWKKPHCAKKIALIFSYCVV